MSPATAHVVALGAGRMGRGLATALAYAGIRVTVLDARERSAQAQQALQQQGHDEVLANMRMLAQLGAFDAAHAQPLAQRVQWAHAGQVAEVLASADWVFEGVTETLAAKQDALALCSQHCGANAILTSTTSSILVTQLAPLVQRPERFFNMHWLNPAFLIPVVEISTHPHSSTEAVQRTRDLLHAMGKLPVVCGPAPGYVVPRLQALMMNEAARMVDEGIISAQDMDVATRYGLGLRFAALGVLEFIDFGGADILYHASRELAASVSAERYATPPVIERMMQANQLGLKTGQGFFSYQPEQASNYRLDAMTRVMAMLRHANMWRPPALPARSDDKA
jgi:3-hydroxybutyryl-CoA dehydrogenase